MNLKLLSFIIFLPIYIYLVYNDLKSSDQNTIKNNKNIPLIASILIIISYFLLINPIISYFKQNKNKNKKIKKIRTYKTNIREDQKENIEIFSGNTIEFEKPILNTSVEQIEELSKSLEKIDAEIIQEIKKPRTITKIITKNDSKSIKLERKPSNSLFIPITVPLDD
eukprot:TRINITY_DN839_c0_g1_i1.p1 TRINITY_DN839_c0_g1~~TRINITY_DN839_c0_g1_i1.p1  ORF type:complete len:167 (-),score=21.72 TRINITY_DN839_c0_g1_i1:87-587(-)